MDREYKTCICGAPRICHVKGKPVAKHLNSDQHRSSVIVVEREERGGKRWRERPKKRKR